MALSIIIITVTTMSNWHYNYYHPLPPHSNAGRSRSSSVALAYVMHNEKLPLAGALERLKRTRPAVEPNEEFMRQLKQLQTSLGISNW